MNRLTLAAIALVASSAAAGAATFTPASSLNLSHGSSESASLQVFSEATDVSIAANQVTVDYVVGNNLTIGTEARGVSSFASGVSLAAGVYNSFLVHFDPTGAGSVTNAVADFGQTIVALIVSNTGGSTTLLDTSDALFGTAATYETGIGRRAESADIFTLTSASAISFTLSTNANNLDNIRVITEATAPAPIPLPASLPLLLAGFGGLAMLRRRRRG